MAPRPPLPPPILCVATSSKTGEPCRRWAKPGTTVCHAHGGKAPHVAAAADRRRLLAAYLAASPRPVWEVLLDAVATGDAMAREVRTRVLSGEPLTDDLLGKLEQWTRLSFTLSSAAITTKATEMSAAARSTPMVDASDSRLVDVLDAVIERLCTALGGSLERSKELQAWARLSASALLDGRVPAPVPQISAIEAVESPADVLDAVLANHPHPRPLSPQRLTRPRRAWNSCGCR